MALQPDTYVFAPQMGSALMVKICSAHGNAAFSIKVAAAHDYSVMTENAPCHLIDAAFLKRLPDGRSLRENMVPLPSGAATLGGTGNSAGQPILGKLSSPLRITVKTVPQEILDASEADRYPLSVALEGALVVDGLPVPLCVSVQALVAAGLAPRDAPPFQSLLDVCGCPGLDGIACERRLFLASFHKHVFWEIARTSDAAAAPEAKPAEANAAADDGGGPQLREQEQESARRTLQLMSAVGMASLVVVTAAVAAMLMRRAEAPA